MAPDEASALLARGGMLQPGLSGAAEDGMAGGMGRLPHYCGRRDPAGAEQLGMALAEAAAPATPDVVLTWDAAEDLVLAHVVARELGTPVARAYSSEGLLGCAGPVPADARVLLLADAYRDVSIPRALDGLVAYLGGQVTGIAALVSTEPMASLPGAPAFWLLPAADLATRPAG